MSLQRVWRNTKPQSAGARSRTSWRYLPSDLDYKHRATRFKKVTFAR